MIWILAKISYFDCGGSRKVEIHKNKQNKRGLYPTTLFFFYKNGKYKKIYPCKGKPFEKKKQCTPSSPKKHSFSSPKRIHAREMSTKKYSCSSKIPQPLHSFSNGPSHERALLDCQYVTALYFCLRVPYTCCVQSIIL